MSLFQLSAEESGEEPEFLAAPASAGPAKRIPSGTAQQEALWAELTDGDSHVLAEARAGCGKSSSCREAMWRMLGRRPSLSVRYCVYNKANADEFRGACPPGVDVATSHSAGFKALQKAHRSNLEKNKTYLILDESREGRNLPRYMRKSVAVLAGHAKNQGLDPADDNHNRLLALAAHHDVNAYGRPQVLAQLAEAVLDRSADWPEVVDFDDMVWLPGLLKLPFEPCDVLFLDEVQDWNPAQHALIPLMAGSGRVVAVGDRFQAINAFRGADVLSIPRLERWLETEPPGGRPLARLPLTVTFRCPLSHVRLANQYVPDLAARAGAPEGEVRYGVEADELAARVAPGDLVICPTNAPVIKAALQLIKARRPCYVRGRALGAQLAAVLAGLGPVKTVAQAAAGVDRWRNRELSRLSQMDGVEDVVESVNDRAASLQAVLAACESPADADAAVASLFGDERRSGVVTFSTVHRAKGDEADRVWFVNAPVRPPKMDWEETQAKNLKYVALTRSKFSLCFVKTKE